MEALPSILPGLDMPHAALLKIERFRDDDDFEFRISSRREVLLFLQAIADQGTRVALYRDGHPGLLLTTLITANGNGLWLDVGPHAPDNQSLLLGEKITFVSMHHSVKIQFASDGIESVTLDSGPAFFMRLPAYLVRIQRREHFRLRLPSTESVKCTIPVAPPKPDAQPELHTVPALDISGGGVGLLCREQETELLPGKNFRNCKLTLPDAGVLTVSLAVRNNVPLPSFNDVTKQRAGCQFVHLDNQMSMLLQRYLSLLERRSLVAR